MIMELTKFIGRPASLLRLKIAKGTKAMLKPKLKVTLSIQSISLPGKKT